MDIFADRYHYDQLYKCTDITDVRNRLANKPFKTLRRISCVINLISANKITVEENVFFNNLGKAGVFAAVKESIPGSEMLLKSFSFAIKSKSANVIKSMVKNRMLITRIHIEHAILNRCLPLLKIDVNQANNEKWINHYLFFACIAGNTNLAFQMIERGGNIFGWNISGNELVKKIRSPLLTAYENGHTGLWKELLLKSDYKSGDEFQQRRIYEFKELAKANNDFDALRFISGYLDENYIEPLNPKCTSELSVEEKFRRAMQNDKKEFLEFILQNLKSCNEITNCLEIAVELGNLDLSVRLFEMRIKIDHTTQSVHPLSSSVIPMALNNHMNPFIKLYLETLPCKMDQVLLDSCEAGNLEIANFCLQNGAQHKWVKLFARSIRGCHLETMQWVADLIPKSEILKILSSNQTRMALAHVYVDKKSRLRELLLFLANLGFDLFNEKYIAESYFYKAALAGWSELVDFGLTELALRSDKQKILENYAVLLKEMAKTEHDAILVSLLRAFPGMPIHDLKSLMLDCSRNGLIQALRFIYETRADAKNLWSYDSFAMFDKAIKAGHDEVACLVFQMHTWKLTSEYATSFCLLYRLCVEKGLCKTAEALLGTLKTLYLSGATHMRSLRILYPSEFLQETLLGETINPHKFVLKGSQTETFYVNLDILKQHRLVVEFISQEEGEIEGLDPEHFKHLLRFFLHGGLPYSYASVKDLITLSNRFKLVELQICIEKWIQERSDCRSWRKKLTLIVE